MIIDTMENISFYFGMSKELDTALSVLKNYDLSFLEPGEYPDFPIEGCNTRLIILQPALVPEDNQIPWEYHENHIDVQCVLKGGSELIGYAPRSKLEGWTYVPEKDTAYTHAESGYLPIRLDEGDFAVFFPQDAHRKVYSTGTAGYRKLVLKIPTDGFRLAPKK